MLSALELPTTDDLPALQRGVQLAVELRQHLFDTYYHATALETSDCALVTADERYLRTARLKGHVIGLAIASSIYTPGPG